MRSQYDGKCKACGTAICAGDEIEFVRGSGVQGCPSCKPGLRPAKQVRAEAAAIRIKIERIVYAKPDGSFVIADVTFDGVKPEGTPNISKNFSVKGPLGEVKKGDVVSVDGEWKNDTKYGWGFMANGPASLAITESEAGLVSFMARVLPNVGQRRAEAIVRELGGREDVLKALEGGEEDAKKIASVKGITLASAQKLQERFKTLGGLKEFMLFAAELGLSESLVNKAIEHWGENAKEMIAEDPYILTELKGIGFNKADEVAQKLKIGRNDGRRCAAVTLWLLEESSSSGHTWTTMGQLARECDKSLADSGLQTADLEKGVTILQKSRIVKKKGQAVTLPPAVTVDGDRIYLAEIEHAERTIAQTLISMAGGLA